MSTLISRLCRHPVLLLAFLLSTASLGWAQQPARVAGAEEDPPARVAHVTERHGSLVFSPEGEQDWEELPANRPLTLGDRLWTDAGGRAELHLGTATLHLDGESHLGISALDAQAAQLVLLQGSVNARVRELAGGENFEIDTPHLAFRARAPGDYRIDVDPQGGYTRVTVRSGTGVVFGEGGQSVSLMAGQSSGFAGRFLAPVQIASTSHDALAGWAAERNAAEDRSVSARYLPRGVVGYPQLDRHGSWSQDPTYGTVWYPQVPVPDWAPYRHGRWTWIAPWGWTWVDDAPWGFAPFHYGRWALIGSRWAWVPGQLAPRPVYAPALVSFFGDGTVSGSVTIGGPAVGWYPLGPGEAWWPTYRSSPSYLGVVNRHIDLQRWPRDAWERHMHRQHVHAITAVRIDDFRHGRPVRESWRSVHLQNLPHWQPGVVPQRPERDRRGAATVPRHEFDRHGGGAEWRGRTGPAHDTAIREQRRAQREQWQLQREALREQAEQMHRQRHWGRLGSAPPQPQGQTMAPQQAPQWQRPQQLAAPIGGRAHDHSGREEGRRGGDRRDRQADPHGGHWRGTQGGGPGGPGQAIHGGGQGGDARGQGRGGGLSGWEPLDPESRGPQGGRVRSQRGG